MNVTISGRHNGGEKRKVNEDQKQADDIVLIPDKINFKPELEVKREMPYKFRNDTCL